MRRRSAIALAACVLASACAAPGTPVGTVDVGWSPRAVANQLDTAFNTAGLPEVRAGVETCYANATPGFSIMRESLRGCLVLDYTAWRIDSRVRGPQLGHSPYWQREATDERWARYGVLAGFETGDELLAYLRRGSDEAVAFMVLIGLAISWQAGFGPRPVQRIRPGTF